jgi:hypothetical protein
MWRKVKKNLLFQFTKGHNSVKSRSSVTKLKLGFVTIQPKAIYQISVISNVNFIQYKEKFLEFTKGLNSVKVGQV